MTLVTLLTDFGTADGYVAEVKGTILQLAPGTGLVDLTHDIPPGDVAAAAYALGRAWRTFPAGTVHLAVVDPGVGTARRALAAEIRGHRFVAPDNGLLTGLLLAGAEVLVSLPTPPGASATFHARDLFAPAAAALARGTATSEMGDPVTDPVRLPVPRLERQGTRLLGAVIHVDRFGTLVTNLPGARVATGAMVRVGAYDIALHATFGGVAPGELVAFVGSGGTVEIAVRDGRADSALGLGRGADAVVEMRQ